MIGLIRHDTGHVRVLPVVVALISDLALVLGGGAVDELMNSSLAGECGGAVGYPAEFVDGI